jgi:iron transport multicopper oxidase
LTSAFFNDVTYVSPKVPTLYTVLSTGPNATNPTIYGSNTNAFVLAQNEVVEIVLNNDDPGKCVTISSFVSTFLSIPRPNGK